MCIYIHTSGVQISQQTATTRPKARTTQKLLHLKIPTKPVPMARFVLFCFMLLQFLTVQALINQSDGPDHQNQSPSKFHRKLKLESSAEVSRISDPPVELKSTSSGEDESAVAEAPKVEIRRLEKHRSDKSVAGGGVIIGGLATAILAAVFCYIRVTRPRKNDPS